MLSFDRRRAGDGTDFHRSTASFDAACLPRHLAVLFVAMAAVILANTNQADLDNDGIGDACEGDRDGDNVSDASDNCPLNPNAAQEDGDQDDIGDACDDSDSDSLLDPYDNCPTIANTIRQTLMAMAWVMSAITTMTTIPMQTQWITVR